MYSEQVLLLVNEWTEICVQIYSNWSHWLWSDQGTLRNKKHDENLILYLQSFVITVFIWEMEKKRTEKSWNTWHCYPIFSKGCLSNTTNYPLNAFWWKINSTFSVRCGWEITGTRASLEMIYLTPFLSHLWKSMTFQTKVDNVHSNKCVCLQTTE